MTFVERVLELIEENNITKNKLLTDLKLGKNSFVNWLERGTIPSGDVLIKIADYFNVSVDYLLGKTSNIILESAQPVDSSQMISIPVLGRVAAGKNCYAEKDIMGYELVSPDTLREGYDYIYLKVKGDSMEPFLMDGDYVLVQIRDVVRSGVYAVVIVDGEDGLVKKMEYDDEHISLISINPYYPPRNFVGDEMNRVKVIGKVVEVKRKI